jgi:tetratricopeptide (TPR) repeat protein
MVTRSFLRDVEKANLLQEQGKFEEALAILSRLAEEYPEQLEMLVVAAQSGRGIPRNNPEAAYTMYTRIAEMMPGANRHDGLMSNRVTMGMRFTNKTEALRLAEEYLKEWPTGHSAGACLIFLANNALMLGQKDVAIAHFRRVLELPNLPADHREITQSNIDYLEGTPRSNLPMGAIDQPPNKEQTTPIARYLLWLNGGLLGAFLVFYFVRRSVRNRQRERNLRGEVP